MIAAHALHPLSILAWCTMRTHWHFVVWPQEEGEVTAYFRWLSHTHAMRWHVAHNTVGCGHLYQGRFKSFPVEEDEHFLKVCRYVERNALTANVVRRAENWRWGSLWARRQGGEELRAILSDWPLARPRDWMRLVNEVMSERELEKLCACIARNRPFPSVTADLLLRVALNTYPTDGLRLSGRVPELRRAKSDLWSRRRKLD